MLYAHLDYKGKCLDTRSALPIKEVKKTIMNVIVSRKTVSLTEKLFFVLSVSAVGYSPAKIGVHDTRHAVSDNRTNLLALYGKIISRREGRHKC